MGRGAQPAPCQGERPIVTDPSPLPPIDLDDTPAGRILATARAILVRERYSGLTMDALAFALGMSKKTIYVHFPSKEAIVSAIIAATGATIRRRITAVMDGPGGFPDKFEAVLGIIAGYFGAMRPDYLQDLQRHAPQLYREIDALKEHNIPLVFRRVLAFGVAQGHVRADIDVTFLIEYWLQVIKGVHDPVVLNRTGLTPRAAFEKALDLFIRGVLTDAGRAQSRWGESAAEPDPQSP
ncbi:MAG: TetR/AcrR family transcriptional regulator [Azospirillaceae bacterium]|nr:TetR/AcrR family transcriptional regulator [Azospirillaceae bacterium]